MVPEFTLSVAFGRLFGRFWSVVDEWVGLPLTEVPGMGDYSGNKVVS